MVKTIDMQGMRYLNLFEKITGIRTRFFFNYNNMLVFVVPKPLIAKALGKDNSNLRRMSEIIKKRIRVIAQPRGIEDIKIFIQSIVNPLEFKDLEVKEDEIILTAGKQSKAALLGRDKRRLIEMKDIVGEFFNMEFRIA
ncbi:MAG: hypothetical protein KC516_01315 [Nanoarchaeota archaeon]|nr:hypothetical protein [Nanoarchaeota archaeon]